jgi:alpha-beta hydrolase superfamily lysophospholipase
VIVCHGAGSRKENHFDFARAARGAGLAALVYDARGHGASEGEWGPPALTDVLALADLLRGHAPRIALRGSSLGGFTAIHAAALVPGAFAAVVALCPAPGDLLLRSLRAGRLEGARVDRESTEPWLGELDLGEAAAALAPDTALLLLHAGGDEQVPVEVSEELLRRAGEPRRLVVVPGGHHRSLQHDEEITSLSLRFVERAVRPLG